MLDKLLLIVFVLLFFLTWNISHSHSASNIAIHKTYTLSFAPNYSLSAPSFDTNSLTDGKYTQGYFWTQKSTLGWQYVKNVEILIDLGEVTNIDSIAFSTARGKAAGVYYPSQIAAFIGSSQNRFFYVGDIAKDSENTGGAYQTKKFGLHGIAAKGRYVLLDVRPNGPFLFCDEVEVFSGSTAASKAETLSLEGARVTANNLSRLSVEKKFLTGLTEKLRTSMKLGSHDTPLLAKIEQRIDALVALTDVEAIELEILRYRAELLRARFPGKQFLLETVNPWAPFSPLALPVDVPEQKISLTMPQVGYAHAAFVVTNLGAESQEIVIQPAELSSEAPALAIHHAPFVKSAAIEYVADPLVPINGSVMLRSGESRMVFLTAKGERPGKWQSNLIVAVGANRKTVPLTLDVFKVALPDKMSLNAVNWGYLDLKPIRNRKNDAVKDLFSHHINIFVVPAWNIPFYTSVVPSDILRMENYLSLSNGAEKVMFFFNFNEEKLRTINGKYEFMSDEWKKWFKDFYTRLVQSVGRSGFTENQMYVYPFDEMHGKDIDRFIAFATWARKEIPAIKIYATLERKESLKALPYLDVAQVINREDMFSEAINSKKEIWIYGASDNTKSLSPYSYYRLMSWQAFYLGFKGAGFWNYADTGSGENPGSAWDDFDGKRPDFSVIYEGENGTIVSSRRWEAWRMGVEDFELLSMYAKAKGEILAKALAKTVLDNLQDVSRADAARQRILNELLN